MIEKKVLNAAVYTFFVALILLKFPSLHFDYNSTHIRTYEIAQILIGIIFLYISVFYYKFIISQFKVQRSLFVVLSIFLLSQGVSYFASKDVGLFLINFLIIAISICVFVCIYFFVKKNPRYIHWITIFVVSVGVITTITELLYLTTTHYFLRLFDLFFTIDFHAYYEVKLLLSKRSFEMMPEIFLPFWLYFFFSMPFKKSTIFFKIGVLILILINFVVAIVGNVHIHFILSLLVSVFFSFLFLGKKHFIAKRNFFMPIALGICLLLLIAVNNLRMLQFTSFPGGSSNQSFRIYHLLQSIQLVRKSPLIGIGLGNYSLYNPPSLSLLKAKYGYYSLTATFIDIQYSRPKSLLLNILSETGLFGFISFLMLLAVFVRHDYRYIRRTGINMVYCYIFGFWVLTFYCFAEASYSLFFLCWLWFFRGIIEVTYTLSSAYSRNNRSDQQHVIQPG